MLASHLAHPQREILGALDFSLLCPRLARLLAICVVAPILVLATGCGRPDNEPDTRVHVAGADRKVRLELDSGPLGDLVVGRDTGGAFVVSGLCYFPDGTRVTVNLYDSLGTLLTRTQPVVEHAYLASLPLHSESGRPWPPGRYAIELSASFAPGAQPPQVLRAAKSGSAFHGAGMVRTRQGEPAFSRRFQVSL